MRAAVPVAAAVAFGAAIAAAAAQDLGPRVGPPAPFVPAASHGEAFPSAVAKGLLTFRGNPTRSWRAPHPLPARLETKWRRGPFCGPSTDGAGTRTWCGTGWTGQPVVRETAEATEIIFGAYDHQVHFLDARTGRDRRAPFRTGDIIKGSVSLDPSGAPLLFVGSRDNFLRILRLDADRAVELWRLAGATADGVWNNDWDGSPLVLGDHLFAGGENSWFHAVALNRGRDADGRASVRPEIVSRIPGFTPALFAAVGDRMASIESSPMALGGAVWFVNSAGLVQGYDMGRLIAGAGRQAALVLEHFAGDDADATLIGGPSGEIYVAVEDERAPSPAKRRTGQLARLDPARPDDPLVWGLTIPGRAEGVGGLWATPVLHRGHLHVPLQAGGLLTVEAATGRVTQRLPAPIHGWSSPVIVGDELLVATCAGDLRIYALDDPARPRERLRHRVPGAGCFESTPAVWRGRIYLGGRDGHVYAL
ncbi:MAG: PQQ-binding-like beta-propeller repeat protein, partial [Pseudomonadota bacterium]